MDRIYNRQLSTVTYMQKSAPTTLNSAKFPLLLKEVGFLSKPHVHFGDKDGTVDYMILYSLSGVVQLSHGDEIDYIHQSDLVVAPCSSKPRFRHISGEDWEFLYLIFNGTHAEPLYNILKRKKNVFRIHPPAAIIDPFVQLLELEYDDSDHSAVTASSLIHSIISIIYDSSMKLTNHSVLLPSQYTQVNAAIDYIRDHYQEDCSIDRICAYVGFSKYHFCRVFKEITGSTIHQFVNRYRINQAKYLLSRTDMPVAEVGAEVGLRDSETFSRVFKAETNMTPHKYRQSF